MSRFDALLWVALVLPACGGDGCHQNSDDSGGGDDSVGVDCDPCASLSDMDDQDGDNLSTRDECYHGTDPDLDDSDDDNLLDGYEVAQGSDPLNKCSTETPYEGGWIRSPCCNAPVATEPESGGIPPNFSGPGQYEDVVELYQFCDLPVTLVVSSYDSEFAEFETYGPLYEHWYEKYRDDGFMLVLYLMAASDGSVPEAEDVDEVVDKYSLSFPVILDPEAQVFDWTGRPISGVSMLMSEGLVIEEDIAQFGATEDDIVSLLEDR